MTTHLMIDIESLGTRPGAIVTSVALVRFTDEAHCSFNLSVPDQQALELEVDPATEAWWAQQDPVARQLALANPLPLASALPYLSTWVEWAAGGQDWQIWCHGATFDCPLLSEVYRRAATSNDPRFATLAGIPCPWNFWQVRDTRTLYDLALINPKDYAVPPPHVALNDAIGQTRAAVAAMKILARAHASQGTWRRYFHHPESDSTFFTDDGSFPTDGLSVEITGGEYFEHVRRQGAVA